MSRSLNPLSKIYFDLANIPEKSEIEFSRFYCILANVSNFNAPVIGWNITVEQVILVQLTHKAPIKTAAEDRFCDIFLNF